MPITPDDDPKLQKLDAELKAARAEFEDDYNPKPDPNDENVGVGARAGVELVGSILGGGLIGYGLDYYFEPRLFSSLSSFYWALSQVFIIFIK